VTRKLDLSGKLQDILIGVFTSAYSKEEAKVSTDADAFKRARGEVENPQEVVLKINGTVHKPIYIENEAGFTVNAPPDNVMQLPAGNYNYFAAGYFYRLKPEAGRKYIIEFGGTRGKSAAQGFGEFTTFVTYEVTT
jgi:hypothetical protein